MKSGRLVGAAVASGELAEWRRLQRKKLNKLGRPITREWPQCHSVSSWQGRHSCHCQKEKSRLSRLPDREMGESQGEREPHLGEIKAGAWRGEY